MDLNDLKNTWNKQNNPRQQIITSDLIDKMTQKKYQSKIKKLAYPEAAGALICLAAAVYIGVHFYKLDTLFLQGVGVLSILLLVIIVTISFLSLKQMILTEDVNQPHGKLLKNFALQKLRFYKLQKINFTLGYLLLVTIIILLSKFFGNNDLTDSKSFWTFSFTLGYIFLLFFSRFVAKYYKKTLQQSEELLQALEV